MKTHLHPMSFQSGGRGTRLQVLFFIKAPYSCCMAERQFGSVKACLTDLGSQWANKRVGLTLGKWIPDFDPVCMGYVFGGLWGEVGGRDEGVDSELVTKGWHCWLFCEVNGKINIRLICLCSTRRLNKIRTRLRISWGLYNGNRREVMQS